MPSSSVACVVSWLAIAVLAGCFLTSCSENRFDAQLKAYPTSLSRVLDQPAEAIVEVPRQRLPDKRDLFIEISNPTIDILDFVQIGRCELQAVVAEKNSSLGRLAADSIALRQDIRFLMLVDACLARIDNDELMQALTEAKQHKRAFLQYRLWNALFAGPEFKSFWRVDRSNYPEQVESQLQYSLSELQVSSAAILETDQLEQFVSQNFENALLALRSGEAGTLVESWRLVAEQLDVATQIAIDRAERRPLCFPGMKSPQADIFRNLVLKRFVAEIQKDIAILNQRYYDVVLPLRVLEQDFVAIETAAYRTFRQDRDALLEQARDSVKTHVAALRPLMVQCGFIPEV